MRIPDELNLRLLLRSDGVTPGFWIQHHRDEAAHVGVVTARHGRQSAIVQNFYVDYLPHQLFSTLAEARDVAKRADDKLGARLLAQFPTLVDMQPVSPSHPAARCSVFADAATHQAVLQWSWHELCQVPVFLGRRARTAMTKSGAGAQWLRTTLEERRAQAPHQP